MCRPVAARKARPASESSACQMPVDTSPSPSRAKAWPIVKADCAQTSSTQARSASFSSCASFAATATDWSTFRRPVCTSTSASARLRSVMSTSTPSIQSTAPWRPYAAWPLSSTQRTPPSAWRIRYSYSNGSRDSIFCVMWALNSASSSGCSIVAKLCRCVRVKSETG